MRLGRGHDVGSEYKRPPRLGVGGLSGWASAVSHGSRRLSRDARRRAGRSERYIPAAYRYNSGNRQPEHAPGATRRMPVDIQAQGFSTSRITISMSLTPPIL